MSNVVIHGEGLGKRYNIGHAERYSTLRDMLARSLRAPWTLFRPAKNETFWALKNVSLEVHEAEVIGLIGRNGSGKTTLLKILSRITRPTTGRAEIHGRVGSLLEVGTGFHPELTGRENIFLSGAVLGMGKAEIARKFDEIVAFAEVEKFIDTPVKHYSSGMFVRLAFAVAAHLESEILLVDEVLAVGDINFQKKCLGKMGDVARAGRTVVLVSHQLNQIRRLCDRVMWIDAGAVRQNSAAHEVVSAYESAMLGGDRNDSDADRNVSVRGRFIRWRIVALDCQDAQTLSTLGPVEVRFSVQIQRPVELGHHGVALFNSEGQLIWGDAQDSMRLAARNYEFSYTFPYLPLRPGSYSWRVSLYDAGELVDAWDCLPQMLVATEPLAHPRDEWAGILNLPSDFCVLSEVERPS